MAKQSIALHSRLTADASGMISEFKRADNESRRATASMRASVGNTMRQIQREFSLPKLAKGVMAGFGIGGGMQLVDLAITKVIEGFQAGAKHAEEMSDAIEKMRTSLSSLRNKSFENIMAGLAPTDRPEKISKELAYNAQLMQGAEAAKAQAELDMRMAREGLIAGRQYNPFTQRMTEDPFGGRFAAGTLSDEILADAAERQAKASEKIDSIRERIGELSRKHAQAVEEAANGIRKAQEDQFNLYIEELKLGAGRSPAQVRSEIGPENVEAGRRAWEQMLKDREDAGRDEFDRWAKAGAVRVDDMTRRGMGTGADYKSIGETTNNILSQILDATRRAIAEMKANPPRFAD